MAVQAKDTRESIAVLRARLLDWYERSGRSLPWRIRPEDAAAGVEADAYAIWLSEIMLQQTTVPHATPFWYRFLELWPQIADLAAAPRDRVMSEWAGLGYYARARNLHACAQAIVAQHGGHFPSELKALKALPGVGEYTANAIRAAAFDLPASVVDGNVERVLSRFDRLQIPLPAAKPAIRKRAAELADPARSRDYAQAIMDLGATVCLPRSPVCTACPWEGNCQARRQGDMTLYPKKTPRSVLPQRTGEAWLVRRNGHVWLRQRADEGLLGGMMEVPSAGWDKTTAPVGLPEHCQWTPRGEVRHVFTHFELRLSVRETELETDWQPLDGGWVCEGDLDTMALPSLMKKVLAACTTR